jgi:flagellar basal body P-ring protein FlgI
MPHISAHWRLVAILGCLGLVGLGLAAGCAAPLFRGQNPENKPDPTEEVAGEGLVGTHMIGSLVVPQGLDYLQVDSVALATQLSGTGSDPPPSPMRDNLRREMQTHHVQRPDEALASENTAMVLVRGYIPPAAQKGDRFDVHVQAAPRTDTTSLRGGWLMSTRMRQLAVLDNSVHTGHVAAISLGPILCDALFDKSQDPVLENRGRVLGGGVVQIERPLGLAIRAEYASIKSSSMIGAAINERFHDFDRGTKKGLANPTRDNYIELRVHSRYRENIGRFIQVVRHVAVGESPVERLARLSELEKQLLEPTTSQRAALQLEAMGKEALSTLRKGLGSSDPEVRFYAAESMAYLDDGDATAALYEAARAERAFRWRAMLALAVMDQFASQDALLQLMNSPSAEARYGAFRALRVRNPHDPLMRGEIFNDEYAFHIVHSTGEPMIHISRSRRPEIVVFGQPQKLEAPSFVFAGKHILVKRHSDQQVKVTRFAADGEDKYELCTTDLGDVIRTIAKLGGNYADVMQAIDEARSKGFLSARVEIDALPRAGRTYHRDESTSSDDDPEDQYESPDSIPDLFLDRLQQDADVSKASAESTLDVTPQAKKRSWLDRWTAWMVE